MLNKIINFFVIVLIFVIGTLFGFYVSVLIKKYTSLNLDTNVGFEINPFEIFSVFTNILLAFIVARTISKQNDKEKNEKDLLINFLQRFSEDFSTKISQLLDQPDLNTPLTRTKFKVFRKQLDSILNLCKEYSFLKEAHPESQQLKEKVTDLWELFTDTPRQQSSRSKSQSSSDIETLRLEKISQIENTLIEVEKLIFKLVFEINRK